MRSHGAETRPPVYAGRFYPQDPAACAKLVDEYLHPGLSPADAGTVADAPLGGIVPHAGWVCSGAVAGRTVAALAAARPRIDVAVVFGAIHAAFDGDVAGLDDHARWLVPGGEVDVSADLRACVLETGESAAVYVLPELHAREHAIEVELPLVRRAWPDAAFLPIEVPLADRAAAVGDAVARAVESLGLRAVYLASSDLTHYGPAYDFAPAGIGAGGLAWAMDNDRALLERVAELRVEQVVPIVRARRNACGGGAIAAMLAACRAGGARGGRVLEHVNSSQTCGATRGEPSSDAVGYASVVVG